MKRQQGFSLIEVLLAVVVLAIGLLAGSRMQMLGLNYTQGGMIRSHATLAANDILDRIRLNREHAIDNSAYDNFDTSGTIPAGTSCITTGCTPAQIAQTDLREWAGYFAKGDEAGTSTPLQNATGTITRAGPTFTVVIEWSELIAGNAEDRQISVSARL